jgi:hypothetical protein
MKEISFKQIFSGIAASLLVLFFLIIASEMKALRTLASSITNNLDTQLVRPITSTGELYNPAPPENIMLGSFNIETDGNVVYLDEKNQTKKLHYKAIRSEKLKNGNQKPQLVLQVENSQEKSWKNYEWSWINYDQGILYFYFKSEENGIESFAENFTGNYQLIFN